MFGYFLRSNKFYLISLFCSSQLFLMISIYFLIYLIYFVDHFINILIFSFFQIISKLNEIVNQTTSEPWSVIASVISSTIQ